MIWFVIAIIFGFIALLIFAFGKDPKTGKGFRSVGFLPLFLGIPFLILSLIAIVGPRNVGVEHTFNKTTGNNHEAGWVWKKPWVSVEDVDTRIQPEEYKGDDCIYVKIADGGRACVTVAYRWRINQEGADEAFKDYGKDDDIIKAVRSGVVSTNMKAALNEAWSTFDPLDGAEITPGMSATEIANIQLDVVPDYQFYNGAIKDNFEDKVRDLGDIIDLESVTVSYIALPEATQNRIDTIKNKVLDSKAALLDVATKSAQAQGNIALAESLKDPNVLVSKCIDGLISGDITNVPGFNCWGPGGAVVLPSAK